MVLGVLFLYHGDYTQIVILMKNKKKIQKDGEIFFQKRLLQQFLKEKKAMKKIFKLHKLFKEEQQTKSSSSLKIRC